MRKNTIIGVIVVVILLVAAAVAVVAYQNNQTKTMNTMNTTSNSTTNSSTNTNTTEPSTTTGMVTIQNFSFMPETITINKGETVTWQNNDSSPHQVVADDNSFQLSTMNKGDTSTHTFDTTGTYKYHCSIHPDMTGVVIVQ